MFMIKLKLEFWTVKIDGLSGILAAIESGPVKRSKIFEPLPETVSGKNSFSSSWFRQQ